jgi:hypothetical protein
MKDRKTARTARKARTRRHARRSVLAILLALAALVLGAASAQAHVVTIDGRRVSLEVLPSAASRHGLSPALAAAARPAKKSLPVQNKEGGPVMPSNTNYAIFWDPSGGGAFPAGFQAGIERWFTDLAHDSGGLLNTDSVLTQYGANYNSHFAGAYIDTDPFPANGCSAAPKCLSEPQVRAELVSFVQAHSLPTDLEHMYFLLTPPEVESCQDEAEKVCSAGTGPQHRFYCSYHEFIELPKGVLVFAYTPYMAGLKCGDEKNTPNGNPSDEELAGGLVHEHSEGVTDPELNAWFDEQGNEVGDKCRSPIAKTAAEEYGTPLGEAPNGSSFNQLINSDRYWYQQEWSNEAGGCAQRRATVPTIKKMVPKNGPATGATAVTITGTGFIGTVEVDFGTAPAKSVKVESPTTLVAVSPAHEAGTVFVTVTTAGGTSEAESKKAKFKYKKVKTPKGPH